MVRGFRLVLVYASNNITEVHRYPTLLSHFDGSVFRSLISFYKIRFSKTVLYIFAIETKLFEGLRAASEKSKPTPFTYSAKKVLLIPVTFRDNSSHLSNWELKKS